MRIMIATGKSGGHVFPALEVAKTLRHSGHEVVFTGHLGFMEEVVKRYNFSVYPVQLRGSNGFHLCTAGPFLYDLIKSTFLSINILKKFDPQVVLGFGSFGAFPVVLSASLMGMPTLIHEQNVIPGKANALLSRFVNKVAVSFSISQRYFNPRKTIFTGCPGHFSSMKLTRKELLEEFNLKDHRPTILILGGSQGSQRINQVWLNTVPLLNKQVDIQVIHICGKKDYPEVKRLSQNVGIPYQVCDFLEDMEQAYALADLAISRSGAVTVTELAHFEIPTIFIPYPHAGGHQKANAAILFDIGIARILAEHEFTAARLKENILEMLAQRFVSTEMKEKLHQQFPRDSALRIAQEAVALGQVC